MNKNASRQQLVYGEQERRREDREEWKVLVKQVEKSRRRGEDETGGEERNQEVTKLEVRNFRVFLVSAMSELLVEMPWSKGKLDGR